MARMVASLALVVASLKFKVRLLGPHGAVLGARRRVFEILARPFKILGARLGPHGAVLWGARSRLGNFGAPLKF